MVETEIEAEKEKRAERRRGGGRRLHCMSWREGVPRHPSLRGLLSSRERRRKAGGASS